MFYTYVLHDRNKNKFYIGYTSDIQRRLKEHKSGSVHTTARFSALELIFYEYFISQEDAKRQKSILRRPKVKNHLDLF